ncbi:MAG TPA: TIGR03746 family integrating conjugative element protein [Burkholderiaceae bacterium]|nr:TIGR03746 family integrating conjugative element protein [Burkholderiaceae bacterium]
MAYTALVDQLRAEIRARNWFIGGSLTLFAVVSYWLYHKADNVNVHVAPDLRASEVVPVRDGKAAVPPANVYSFALYVWQQVNRWKTDGGKDYGKQIFAMQNYLTPRCRQWLQTNMDEKAQQGELSLRTRSLMEWPGRGYESNRVIANGGDGWMVLLDVQLLETMKGQPVKDVAVRWPVPVVRYAIDLQRNPYRLAVDCNHESVPARLEIQDDTPLGPDELEASARKLRPAPLPAASASTVEKQP